MTDLLPYLWESSFCILLFFLFYKLMLSHLTFFQWRRVFWLAGVSLSLVIPALDIELSGMGKESLVLYPSKIVEEFENSLEIGPSPREMITTTREKEGSDLPIGQLFVTICYVSIVLLLFIKLAVKVFIINQRGKNSRFQNFQGYKVIESDRISIPYTFLNKIYLPKNQAISAEERNFILEHEKIHVFQKHTLDIIFISLVKIFFWFNPLYTYILKDIKLLHEYIADNYAGKKSAQEKNYAKLLLKLASTGSNTVLTNNFSKLQIKERIIMLKKDGTKPLYKLRFLFLAPLLILLIFAFSMEKKVTAQNAGERTRNFLISSSLLPGLANSKISTPSGWPLANEFHKISSGFGMRKHPIENIEKMHKGIDLPAPMGTPVFATADGIVTMVKNFPGGYGKYIRIKHGEYETVYAQLSAFEVKAGDRVYRGQLIGRVGSSGLSTAPHLHYEVIKNGEPIDPEETFC